MAGNLQSGVGVVGMIYLKRSCLVDVVPVANKSIAVSSRKGKDVIYKGIFAVLSVCPTSIKCN
jgi:hypothetical protein